MKAKNYLTISIPEETAGAIKSVLSLEKLNPASSDSPKPAHLNPKTKHAGTIH